MIMRKYGKMMLLLATAAWAGLFLAGCGGDDDDPNTSELDGYFEDHPYVSDPRISHGSAVTISPRGATANAVGEVVIFAASGGTPPYHWDVSDGAVGTAAGDDDGIGRYTARTIGNNYVIVYDQDGNADFATISGTNAPLAITPNPAEVTNDWDLVVLEVSGGSPTYTWTVMDDHLGFFINGVTGESVVYQRYRSGNNAVTVTDGSGNRASMVVKQPPP